MTPSTSPISTALLSYGMSGKVFHAPLLAANPGFQLSTVLQRSSDDAKLKYPQATIVRSFEDVLKQKDVELVIINTPNATHYEFAARALEAGKHVVVEKPFTVRSSEGQQLIELAQRKNKILTVFQNRRWDGDFLTVKNILAQKLLGNVVEFEMHYDRYRNYIEPNTWKEEAAPGSGILYNLGSHMIDQAIGLFGLPNFVDARTGIQRTGGKVDDYYDIRMEYTDLLMIVKSSYLVREPMPRYIVHGSLGSFVKYGIDPQEQDLKEGKIPGSTNWGKEPKTLWGKLNTEINGAHVERLEETEAGNYPMFYQSVFDAIRLQKPLAVKPEESLQGLQIIEAVMESNTTKRAVAIKS
jgi:scyllo-inositol 2-dehydrogenase (NADP+)